jgi:hypothetical protein
MVETPEMAFANSLVQNVAGSEDEMGVMTVALKPPASATRNVEFIKTTKTEVSDTSESVEDTSAQSAHIMYSIDTNGVHLGTIDVVVICIVLVILIRALTIIALKRGFSFSKGNVVFHVGEKKKTRKRTKTKSKTENSD